MSEGFERGRCCVTLVVLQKRLQVSEVAIGSAKRDPRI